MIKFKQKIRTPSSHDIFDLTQLSSSGRFIPYFLYFVKYPLWIAVDEFTPIRKIMLLTINPLSAITNFFNFLKSSKYAEINLQ
jgi:hypothetical protein